MGREFLVVGGGTQGRVAARALARGPGRPDVVVADLRAAPQGWRGRWIRAEAGDPAVARAASDADATVVALPGDLADPTVLRLAGAGARVADMSFVPEPWSAKFDRTAKRAGGVVVRDVGVAPGISHVLAAALHEELGGLDRLTVYVGGLPRRPPAGAFRHAVYFNAVDLLSEYTRPARLRRSGRNRRVRPLSAAQQRSLRDGELGPLEAFPSDGLRTLLGSFPACPEMEEYTLRWPGHLQEMRRMESEGLLAAGVGGGGPSTFTAVALEEALPGRDHPDVLLMEVQGTNGEREAAWRLVDRGKGGQSAMGRTTGFMAAAAARSLAAGRPSPAGLHPPEVFGRDAATRRAVLGDLRRQGLRLTRASRLREDGR
jgi:saccharopine dehydrogenase-like NADP-dependent oxidoreductase